MSSFFEKLKKGMEVEEPIEEIVDSEQETEEEKPSQKPEIQSEEKKPKKKRKKTGKKVKEPEAKEENPPVKEEKIEIREESVQEKKIEPAQIKEEKDDSDDFGEQPAGQLAIDLYHTETEIVIQAAIAGIKPIDLQVSIERDMVTIKGVRGKPNNTGEKRYLYQECYWGPFYREIILPEEVDPSRIDAEMKEGILTIRVPKILRQTKRRVTVKG